MSRIDNVCRSAYVLFSSSPCNRSESRSLEGVFGRLKTPVPLHQIRLAGKFRALTVHLESWVAIMLFRDTRPDLKSSSEALVLLNYNKSDPELIFLKQLHSLLLPVHVLSTELQSDGLGLWTAYRKSSSLYC